MGERSAQTTKVEYAKLLLTGCLPNALQLADDQSMPAKPLQGAHLQVEDRLEQTKAAWPPNENRAPDLDHAADQAIWSSPYG